MKLAASYLSAALATSAFAGDVKLAWDLNPPSDQIQAYLVYERAGTNFIKVASVLADNVVLKDLAPGQHCFSVTAVNPFSESGYSSEACVVLPADALQNPNDTIPPTSTVAPLPENSSTYIPVSWSGQDQPGGSGLATFDVYVSENGRPYELWLAGVTNRQANFTGTFGSSYEFFALATDNAGNKSLFPSGPQARTTVALVNTAPVLEVVPAYTAKVGDILMITNHAFDVDVPSQKLRFELGVNSPTNAAIRPDTGVLYWKPCVEHASKTIFIDVNVFDDGLPNLSGNRRITVRVDDYAEIRLGTNVVESGQTSRLPVTIFSSVPLSEAIFMARMPSTNISSVLFQPGSADVCDRLTAPMGDSSWAVWFKLCGAMRGAGTRQIGYVSLQTVPGSSGFVPIQCSGEMALRGDGSMYSKVGTCGGRTILVADAPLLELVNLDGRRGQLMLYGKAGVPYLIEYLPRAFPNQAPWQFLRAMTLPPGMVQAVDILDLNQPQAYFRAQIDPDYLPTRN